MACFHPSQCQQLSCTVNIQSITAGTLQRQQILTTRAPPSYANDPQDAQEVWIIIIINITIITFRHHRPMQMTPGVPKQFQPDQVIAGCRVVNSRTYCSYTALRAVAFFSLSSTYFMIFSAQTPSRLHRCHLKYACWPKPLLKTLHSTQS